MKTKGKRSVSWWIATVIMIISFIATIVFESLAATGGLTILPNPLHNSLLNVLLPKTFGVLAMLILTSRLGVRILQKPQKLLFVIPCLLIAVNNFPFLSYFSGNMSWKEGVDAWAWILFAVSCLLTGIFEELIFRGVIFPLVLDWFADSKKGLFFATLTSSVIFGLSHLLNLFYGADFLSTLRQIAYSTLTGGMFAFTLIKSKSLIPCALLHAIYNFGGLLLTKEQGLGQGIVFDMPTTIMMAVVAILVGVYVIVMLCVLPDEERSALYDTLGIKKKKDKE